MRVEFDLKAIPKGQAPVQKSFKLGKVKQDDIELGGREAKRKLAAALQRVLKRYRHDKYAELDH